MAASQIIWSSQLEKRKNGDINSRVKIAEDSLACNGQSVPVGACFSDRA